MRLVFCILITFALLAAPLSGVVYSAAAPLAVDDDLGDFAFFDSSFIMHRASGVFSSAFPAVISTEYPNFTPYEKTNKIICERLDHYNVNKGDRIILQKTTGENLYFDIAIRHFANYDSSKVYKYFSLSTDMLLNMEGAANAWVFLLRDSTGSPNVEVITSTVSASGSMDFGGGQVLAGAAPAGTWVNYRAYVDLENRRVLSYVNGAFAGQASIPQSFKTLSMVRAIYRNNDAGNGEIQFKNLRVVGLGRPMENGVEVKTTMFPDDSAVAAYLADKAAFHAYGGTFYASGSRRVMRAAPVWEDGELFLPAGDWNLAFGAAAVFDGASASLGQTHITLERPSFLRDGVRLVPLGESARRLLGKEVLCDENTGLWLVSDTPLPYDPSAELPYPRRPFRSGIIDRLSPLQHISDFVFFDRPEAGTLAQAFAAGTGGGSVHPRVFADAGDFAHIRSLRQTDAHLNALVSNLISQADAAVRSNPVDYVFQDELRLHTQANLFQKNMLLLGFAYQMTNDRKYVDAAWGNFQSLERFPDINPGHPIDAGVFTFGMGIGYDWLYHGYTPAQRDAIFAMSRRLGLTVLNDAYYGRVPARGGPNNNINVMGMYAKWISNYNTFLNGGAIVAALAMAEREPALCFDLLKNAIRSMEYTAKGFSPDGAWIESNGYWEIAAQNLALAAQAMEKTLGSDYQLFKTPGFDKTGRFMLSLQSPLGSYIYHDASNNTRLGYGIFALLGRRYNQPELLAALRMRQTGYFSTVAAISPSVFEALFYTPDVDTAAIDTMPKALVSRGLESFTVHESYLDENALFFASHGGPVSFYHAHNDVGDFVFNLLGEKWAETLDAENYNLPGSAAGKYRLRTEGHNTLTINNSEGFNQRAGRYAEITAHGESAAGAYAVYDMSDIYADADRLHRGFFVSGDYRSVTIRDEMNLTRDSVVYWFMHTKGHLTVTGPKSAVLTRNNKSIFLNFETDASAFELFEMDAVQLDGSDVVAGQTPNANYKKVAIRLRGSGPVNLSVTFSAHNSPADTTPTALWGERAASSGLLWEDGFDTLRQDAYALTGAVFSARGFDSNYLSLAGGAAQKSLGPQAGTVTVDFDFKVAQGEALFFAAETGDPGALLRVQGGQVFYNGAAVLSGLRDGLWYHCKLVLSGDGAALFIDGRPAGEALPGPAAISGLRFWGRGGVDNLRAVRGEDAAQSAVMLEQDFGGFALNAPQTLPPQKLLATFTGLGDAGEAVRFDSADGAFGRAGGDTSFYLRNTEAPHTGTTDPYLNFSDPDRLLLRQDGAVQELSFQCAFDSAMTPIAVNVYAWAGHNGEYVSAKHQTSVSSGFFRLFADRAVVWGRSYPLPAAAVPEKWYHVRIVTTGGERNYVSAYIDDIPICENALMEGYSLRLDGTDYNDGGRFLGFSQIWLNHNFRENKTGADTYRAGGAYFDDLKLVQYFGGAAARRSAPVSFTAGGEGARRLSPHTVIYAQGDDLLGDVAARFAVTGAKSALYRRDGGEAPPAAAAEGIHVEAERQDGSRRYGRIFADNRLYLEKRDYIDPAGGWMEKGTFSSTNRMLRQAAYGLGGRGPEDESTTLLPPFIKDENGNFSDYLYYTLRSGTGSLIPPTAGDQPITVSAGVFHTAELELALQLRLHTASAPAGFYTNVATLREGIITSTGYTGAYVPGEWVGVAYTFFPGTNYFEVRVNGKLVSVYRWQGEAVRYITSVRLGVSAADNSPGKLAAIDDWIVYGGLYREDFPREGAFDSVTLWADGEKLPALSYPAGLLRVRATAAEGIGIAAAYRGGALERILEVAQGKPLDFAVDTAQSAPTHIKLMRLSDWNAIQPRGGVVILQEDTRP